MNRNMKIVLLAALALVIAAIMVMPNLIEIGDKDFAVTPNPEEKLSSIIGQGKPVVLEFYAVW